MSASPELGGKCRALRGDRGKRVYTDQNCFSALLTLFLFLRVCSCLFSILSFLLTLAPSDSYRRHLPRVRGRLYCISISLFFVFPHAFSILSFLSIKKDDRNFLRSSFFIVTYLASSSAIFLCCAAICSLCSIISAFCAFISSCIRPTKAYSSDTVALLSSMRSPPLPTLTDTPTL